MSRTLATLACASCLGLVTGCGGGAEDEVRQAVRGYLESVADGDPRAACARLTENGQLGVFEFRKVHAAPDHPGEACAEVVERARLSAGARARLRGAEIGRVTVDGESAGAVVEGVPVTLRRVDGEWRVDVFGVATDVAAGRHARRQ